MNILKIIIWTIAVVGLAPAILLDDHVTEEGTGFETRHLSYPIDGTVEEVSDLCESIFTDVYGVEKDSELIFTVGA